VFPLVQQVLRFIRKQHGSYSPK